MKKLRHIFFLKLANALHYILVFLTAKQYSISKEKAHDLIGITFLACMRYKDDKEVGAFGKKVQEFINMIEAERTEKMNEH